MTERRERVHREDVKRARERGQVRQSDRERERERERESGEREGVADR